MLNVIFLVSIVTITSTAIAFSSAIVFALIMDYSRTSSKAIDYSIQSSLFSLTRIISAIVAGMIVSNFGYGEMFLIEGIVMGLVLLIVYKLYNTA